MKEPLKGWARAKLVAMPGEDKSEKLREGCHGKGFWGEAYQEARLEMSWS